MLRKATKRRRLEPGSRAERLIHLDARTIEARYMDAIRRELTEHVGGKPSAPQRVLIDQAAQISLRLAMLDRKYVEVGMTELDTRTYLAWSNTLARLMTRLGLETPSAGPAAPPPLPDPVGDYVQARGEPQEPLLIPPITVKPRTAKPLTPTGKAVVSHASS